LTDWTRPKIVDPHKFSAVGCPLYCARRQRCASMELLVSTVCTGHLGRLPNQNINQALMIWLTASFSLRLQPGRRTLLALVLPSGAFSTSKIKRSPMIKLSGSIPANFRTLLCKKISGPPFSSTRKPNPRSAFHDFNEPVAITTALTELTFARLHFHFAFSPSSTRGSDARPIPALAKPGTFQFASALRLQCAQAPLLFPWHPFRLWPVNAVVRRPAASIALRSGGRASRAFRLLGRLLTRVFRENM
jgi:hypothetical protein